MKLQMTLTAVALAVFLTGVRAGEVQFIRGDFNSDGEVTISDIYLLNAFEFMAELHPGCPVSGDSNDDGALTLTDIIVMIRELFLDGHQIKEPFPDPGLDPTPGEGWENECESYGGGSPLEDPAARIQILDAAAGGGADRNAVITVAISNSLPLAAYSFTLVCEALDFSYTYSDSHGLKDLIVPYLEYPYHSEKDRIPNRPAFVGGKIKDGPLAVGCLLQELGSALPVNLPPGEDVAVLDIHACLLPGTPAGSYPVTLLAGELSPSGVVPDDDWFLLSPDAGRAVFPALESGIITIESDVEEGDCDTRVPPPPPPPPKILFKMLDSAGSPGGIVTVPFIIKTDRLTTGFSYSLRFDDALLRCEATRKLWDRPDGTPYEFMKFEWSNFSGYAVGAAVISLTDTGDALPLKQETEMLEIDFRVLPEVPEGTTTTLEFRDGGIGTGGRVLNKIISAGRDVTPEIENSFVFINGRISIQPDGTPFRLGDSNGDGTLDLSDAIFTLAYLYLGGKPPRQIGAADFNGDGDVDLSDVVATLKFLFVGE